MSSSSVASSAAPISFELSPVPEVPLNLTNVLELLAKVDFDLAQIEPSLRSRVLKFCDETTTLGLVGNQTPKYVQSVGQSLKMCKKFLWHKLKSMSYIFAL